jgi:nucleoside-diphosphate-sugar epimerase
MEPIDSRKSLLITGIHGFVGTNLVGHLCSDFLIYGLDIRQDSMVGVERIYSWEELDHLPELYAVIHLAGIAHDLKHTQAKDMYFEVNTGLTCKIYDWFRKSTASHFYFFSSVKAVADSPGLKLLDEESDARPVGPYGESKRAAEEYILKHPLDETDTSKKVYLLRPAMIHGPGNKGNLTLLYQFVKSGLPWPLGAFHNQRSFCSVANLLFILETMLKSQVDSGIYHLADDEQLSTNELIGLMKESMHRSNPIIAVPSSMIRSVARVGGWLRLPLNNDRLQKLTENFIVSNSKIKSALHLDKLPQSAHQGILTTIKSFRK